MPTDQENVNQLAVYLSTGQFQAEALAAVKELYDKAPGEQTLEKNENFNDIIVKNLANIAHNTNLSGDVLVQRVKNLREMDSSLTAFAVLVPVAVLEQLSPSLPAKITSELKERETAMEKSMMSPCMDYKAAVEKEYRNERNEDRKKVLLIKKDAITNMVNILSDTSRHEGDPAARKVALNAEFQKIVSPRGFKDNAVNFLKKIANFISAGTTYKFSGKEQAKFEQQHENITKPKR